MEGRAGITGGRKVMQSEALRTRFPLVDQPRRLVQVQTVRRPEEISHFSFIDPQPNVFYLGISFRAHRMPRVDRQWAMCPLRE